MVLSCPALCVRLLPQFFVHEAGESAFGTARPCLVALRGRIRGADPLLQ